MRKFIFIVVVALVAGCIAVSASAGILLENTYHCNDFYLEYELIGGGMYDIVGYEYGCGYVDRIGSGAARVVGNYVYFSVVNQIPEYGDHGQTASHFIMIDMGTFLGSGSSNYYYILDGVVAGHGLSDLEYIMSLGGPPTTAAGMVDPDASE